MTRDHLIELHSNGVHVHCKAPRRDRRADHWHINHEHGSCARAGTVERVHAHDYDGPLICGCEEGL